MKHVPSDNPKPFGGQGGHPDYLKNEARAFTPRRGRNGGFPASVDEVCCYCGRYVGNPKRYAYLTACGEWTIIEECCDIDFLGFYPLGTDCAAALRRKGVPVYKSNKRYGKPGFEAKLLTTPKGVTPLITTKRERDEAIAAVIAASETAAATETAAVTTEAAASQEAS